MALPSVFGGKKQESSRKVLALDIGLEVVTACLWTVEGGHVRVLSSSSPIEWREDRVEELAEASDVALEELGKDASKVDEVVLGLPESWIQDDAIIVDKKPFLKNIRDQLSLKPIGFVVTHEALVHYLRELEGGPLTALLIEYTTTQILAFQVRAGVKGASITVERSGDSIVDITLLLRELKLESYPARIVLFSARMKQEEIEKEKHLLLAQDWQKDFPFPHVPKVETLPHTILLTAVCTSGGTEIARSLGMLDQGSEIQEEKMSSHEQPSKETRRTQTEKTYQESSNITTAESLGFHELEPSEVIQQDVMEEKREDEGGGRVQAIPTPPKPTKHGLLSSFRTKLATTFRNIFAGRSLGARFSSEVHGTKNIKVITASFVVAVVILSVATVLYLRSSMTADVVITLKTTPIAQDVELLLDPQANTSDPESGALKVEKVEKEVEGQMEAETTGLKIVGDKAKGKVTIYNATVSEKVFPAGTVITGPRDMKFTLDEVITVASSSGSSLLNVQPGTGTVAVTSVNIGTESNLIEKSEFSIANFDKKTYVASNEQAFSGGSSREIQAVSKDDLSKLERLLLKNLEQQAIDGLQAEQTEGTRIVPVGSTSITQKTFSAKAGDEARSVTLTMLVSSQAYRYATSDLLPVATRMLSASLPQGTVLREERTQIDPGEIQATTSAGIRLKATLSSETIPVVDKQVFIESVRKKTIAQAQSILRDMKEVGDVVISIRPAIARLLFSSMPEKSESIHVQTKLGSL
ncbi:MAG TPA: hypothetical protein VJ246_00445 [Patescibacteria group bacterium]|nr:hypothetical protein [Patescibacteria group bacterium]